MTKLLLSAAIFGIVVATMYNLTVLENKVNSMEYKVIILEKQIQQLASK